MHTRTAEAFRLHVVSHLEPVTESGCWIWGKSCDSKGYAQVGYAGKLYRVHRLTYAWAYGECPAGLTLDHLCRVRCCCNPAHLEAVTPRMNTLRGLSPSAVRAKRDHCIHGHQLIGDNLYIWPVTPRSRYCRTCRALRCRMLKQRRRTIGQYVSASKLQFQPEEG